VARANSAPSRRERSAADPSPERSRSAARASPTSSRPSVASAAGAAALHASSTAAGPTPNRSRPERPERNRSAEATAPGGTARRKSASFRTFSVRERVAATASETATSSPNRVTAAGCRRCAAPARRAKLGRNPRAGGPPHGLPRTRPAVAPYTHLQRPPRATQTRPAWRQTPLQLLVRARPQAGASQLHPPTGFGTQLNSASGQLPAHAGAALSEQAPAPEGRSDDEHVWSPSRAQRRSTSSLQARRPCPVAVMQERTALPHARRHSLRDPPSAEKAMTVSSSAATSLGVARIARILTLPSGMCRSTLSRAFPTTPLDRSLTHTTAARPIAKVQMP